MTSPSQQLPRTISLTDRDGVPEDYILLSGDPERGQALTTVRVTPNGGVDLRSWYCSPFEGYVTDPERGIWLDEDEVRCLAAVWPDLVQQLAQQSPSTPDSTPGRG